MALRVLDEKDYFQMFLKMSQELNGIQRLSGPITTTME